MNPIPCRNPQCHVLLVWLPTKTGRHMPVEAASVGPQDRVYDPEKHQEHWSKCTGAKKFKGRQGIVLKLGSSHEPSY